MGAQYPLLYKLHLLFAETDACMALFITCFFWALVRAPLSRHFPARRVAAAQAVHLLFAETYTCRRWSPPACRWRLGRFPPVGHLLLRLMC